MEITVLGNSKLRRVEKNLDYKIISQGKKGWLKQ